ncbi:unnamed protein product, partial [Meganyctiphanes norvegica]
MTKGKIICLYFKNDYISIKMIATKPERKSCVKFLQEQSKELGAKCQVVECSPGNPAVIMTVTGHQTCLSLLFVVTHILLRKIIVEHWKYEPFSAHKDESGNIFGRGTQDMKCVGIQYLEALKQLATEGKIFRRTIHLTFVPEEELGGRLGMGELVKTKCFKEMNVGFALDEGYANPTEKFSVFYSQRSPWWVLLSCPGQPGHGSQFLPNNAGVKLQKVINSFMNFRKSELQRLKTNPSLNLGDVTTVNLTMLEGGVQFNVVPAELKVGFDIRLAPTVNQEEFEAMIQQWCRDAGDGITYECLQKVKSQPITCTENGKSAWWDAFSRGCKEHNVELVKEVFPASTDLKYIRTLGIPALGFSPMNNTPILLHDHNEFLNENIFLKGIDIYKTIITELANVKA